MPCDVSLQLYSLLSDILTNYLSYAYMINSEKEHEKHYLNFNGSTFLPLPLFPPLPPRPLWPPLPRLENPMPA